MAITPVGPGVYRPTPAPVQAAPAPSGGVLPGTPTAPPVAVPPGPTTPGAPVPVAAVVPGAALPGGAVILPVPAGGGPDIYLPPPAPVPAMPAPPASAAVSLPAGTVQLPSNVTQIAGGAIPVVAVVVAVVVAAVGAGPVVRLPEPPDALVQQTKTLGGMPTGIGSTQPYAVSPMAIDRIASTTLTPLVVQRPETGGLAMPPLATPGVPPLLPVDAFSTLLPEGATPPASRQAGATAGNGAQGPAALPAPQGLGRDSTAMQENQVFFSRQVAWQAPDAAALAASWRVMVKTYGEQNAALQDQARGQHIPASLLMAESNPAAMREMQRAPQLADSDAWRFGVYGWGGQRMLLRLLPRDAEREHEGKRAGKRRPARVALRLELKLADGSRVIIQMEPVSDGIALELSAAQPAALAHLRQVLQQLAEVIGAAGVRIVHCRIGQTPLPFQPSKNVTMQAAAAALTLEIFRAMAEAALFLTRPAAPAVEASAPVPAAQNAVYDMVHQQAGIPHAVAAPLPELIDASEPHGDWKWEE